MTPADLEALLRAPHDELTLLQRLAARHHGQPDALLPPRTHDVAVGDRVFPPAEALPVLLALLVLAVRRLFEDARSGSDELLVAAFAAWGVTAIHPFPDANGRAAYDFAHALLARRWGTGPLPFPEGGHAALGPAFAPLDAPSRGERVEDFVASATGLATRLAEASLRTLWGTPNLVAVADHFGALSGRDFQPADRRR